jgi:tetratricopeptide (TPR) repeat protein
MAEAMEARPAGGAMSVLATQLLRRAAALYARGNLPGAEDLCRQLLQLRPEQPDALHILGLIAWRRGDRQQASDHIRAAIASDPTRPQPPNSLGVLLKEAGDLGAAEAAFRTAIELQADYPEALTNLGNILCETDRLAEAEAMHRRVIELMPNYAEAHNNLATALSKQERWAEAAEACGRSVGLDPNRADFQFNLGNALSAMEQWLEAIDALKRATDLAPATAEYHGKLGLALHRLGHSEQAAEAFGIAVKLQPANARTWTDLAVSLAKTGKNEEAMDVSRKALDLDPNLPEAHNALGKALLETGQLSEAMAAFARAIALRPGFALAHCNLGVARHTEGRFAEALEIYEKAIALDPESTETHWNKALTHLLLGEFETGWKLYEYGLGKRSGATGLRFDEYPAWLGADVAGRTLLLWSEQGVGDHIMFASVIPDLLERGATCVVEADPRLEPLFRRSLPEVRFLPRGAVTADVAGLGIDFQVPLGGMCRWLRPNLASFARRRPLLRADPVQTAMFRTRYCQKFASKLVVGISWMGGTGAVRKVRSIPLIEWSAILANPDAAFVNLQYGDCAEELGAVQVALGAEVFHDPAVDPLKDLDSFAAQTAAMDLVISIDNSTVHMAGALDVPVWVMLPAVPDWRWLLGRSDSPWYSSVRLFRQSERGDWSDVFAAVGRQLAQASAARAARIAPDPSDLNPSSAS